MAILKERVAHNYLPESFKVWQIPPPPPALESIEDQGIRQRLSERYTTIIRQSKSDMMALYIASAEAYMDECQIKFDTELAQMKEDQRSGSIERQLSPAMINVLERRLKNLGERLQCLYDLKIRFFVKAPITTKKI